MRKQAYRDYATEAFRFWARTGTASAYRDRLVREIAERRGEVQGVGISKPTEAAILRIEDATDQAFAELYDLEAVDKARAALMMSRDGNLKLRAVELVYMRHPEREIQRGEVKARTVKAAGELHTSERQVYYWLKEAREVFARERGLRV